MNGTLRIIPLGGLGEIGMNCMVDEYEAEAIIIDCGMMFPHAATLGVDVIVPDMTLHLRERVEVTRGHGHAIRHAGHIPARENTFAALYSAL